MSQAESWTIGRLISWTTGFLKDNGSESPRLDAEILLAHSLRCERIDLYTRYDEEPDDSVRSSFRELIQRRAEHAPVAYLVGYKEFYSLRFAVTPDVLIPRPETELLVVAVTDRVRELRDAISGDPACPIAICDVGTGSGAIAVSLAKHLGDNCRIAATDISPAAINVARGNATRHDLSDRIDFFECDLMTGLPSDRKFDIVVSNPPYVSESEYDELDPTVREYEPRLALVSGTDGCDLIRRLLDQAADRLNPEGQLLIELSPMNHDQVIELIRSDDRFEPLPSIRDLSQLDRIVCARRA